MIRGGNLSTLLHGDRRAGRMASVLREPVGPEQEALLRSTRESPGFRSLRVNLLRRYAKARGELAARLARCGQGDRRAGYRLGRRRVRKRCRVVRPHSPRPRRQPGRFLCSGECPFVPPRAPGPGPQAGRGVFGSFRIPPRRAGRPGTRRTGIQAPRAFHETACFRHRLARRRNRAADACGNGRRLRPGACGPAEPGSLSRLSVGAWGSRQDARLPLDLAWRRPFC